MRGGPGTGKSSVVKEVVRRLKENGKVKEVEYVVVSTGSTEEVKGGVRENTGGQEGEDRRCR